MVQEKVQKILGWWCSGVLAQVEGGVVIPPLVLDGALVLPRVRLAGVLKHEVMDATRGDNTNKKVGI